MKAGAAVQDLPIVKILSKQLVAAPTSVTSPLNQ